MTVHASRPSPPPRTYGTRGAFAGPSFTCRRCGRVHPVPSVARRVVRCECGWRYRDVDGRMVEEFAPALD